MCKLKNDERYKYNSCIEIRKKDSLDFHIFFAKCCLLAVETQATYLSASYTVVED